MQLESFENPRNAPTFSQRSIALRMSAIASSTRPISASATPLIQQKSASIPTPKRVGMVSTGPSVNSTVFVGLPSHLSMVARMPRANMIGLGFPVSMALRSASMAISFPLWGSPWMPATRPICERIMLSRSLSPTSCARFIASFKICSTSTLTGH